MSLMSLIMIFPKLMMTIFIESAEQAGQAKLGMLLHLLVIRCVILYSVQTSFYASGFLYNLRTHQILLLESKQNKDIASLWSTMGGDSLDGEDAQLAFQRIINKQLKIQLKTTDIYPIYDYFHATRNKLNYVFYAEIRDVRTFDKFKKGNLSWFTFSETVKLLLTSQTKQDIVVGERVINAKWRDDEAKRNPLGL